MNARRKMKERNKQRKEERKKTKRSKKGKDVKDEKPRKKKISWFLCLNTLRGQLIPKPSLVRRKKISGTIQPRAAGIRGPYLHFESECNSSTEVVTDLRQCRSSQAQKAPSTPERMIFWKY